ncbi:MAG TPA: Kazal-type serine protease inhibitor [Pseudolabrys sp.]
MTIKKLVTGTAIALTAAVFVLGSAVSSEAKSAKKKAEPAPQRSATCIFSAPAPVCGTRGGLSLTYRNACYAGNDGAVVKSDGACKPAKAMKAKKDGKKAMKKGGKKKK